MVRFKKRVEDTREAADPRPLRDRYATRETAAGVFSRPAPPPMPPPPPQRESAPTAKPLSVRPLRTPAPAVTTIRVEAVPVEGFEYETAEPWYHDPPDPPPRPPTPRPPPPKPLFNPLAPKPQRRPINWLDE